MHQLRPRQRGLALRSIGAVAVGAKTRTGLMVDLKGEVRVDISRWL